MPEKLTVQFNQQAVGTITLHGREDSYDLRYAPSWLDKSGFAVLPHLKPGGSRSETVKRFLAFLNMAAELPHIRL